MTEPRIIMDMQNRLIRLVSNYELLVTLYKQGKFEESVRTTDDPAKLEKFYDASDELTEGQVKFALAAADEKPRGRLRQPKDLQWAVGSLRESAQALFDHYLRADSEANS